jgi:DNA-binding HxlR family transcriptional regulator
LEEARLGSRTAFATVPATVEYAPTEEGQRLVPVVNVIETSGMHLKARELAG